MWEEAIRVCRSNGSNKESCELAKKWAESLGPEKGLQKLLKMKLIDAAIEYLTEKQKFEEAFKMAEEIARHKIPDVYLKQAFYFEDEQRYRESEDAFIKAGKPAEAINMW
jgi:intraflagellar transport protein 172